MLLCHQVPSAPTVLLVLLTLMLEPSSTSPVTEDRETVSNQYGPSSSELIQLQSTQERESQQVAQNKEEQEDELFKDVDPKALAAVLLEALNKPQVDMMGNEKGEMKDKGEEEREMEMEGADRDRDGRQELELVMAAAAAQGREEREREEDEERKRAEEEEEQLTEKVTSRTTSQTVPVKEVEVDTKEVVNREGQAEPERGTEMEKEEQLTSQELKQLETMLEEFQSYSTATKRERDSSAGQRESRGNYFDYLDRNGLMNNEIKPKAKGYDLALSKKKLKWQQEQEKNNNRPLYRGGNFMDDFNDNFENQDEENREEEEEEEEVLSPEEEEARAKAEQEEVRRQAAEAQRAKAEEEKLADIASDMLLQYMVKQDGKKYNNAAEDKRSEEDANDDDDDDIDPQTIDKLIEISSKLHLPADDVVDIISDVEKKKKKDAPENQRPLVPLPAPVAPSTALRAPPPSKPPKPNPFKAWFKDRASVKPSKPDSWIKQQWPFRAYPSYRFYQKPYSSYYPVYIPSPKPKARYYAKPSYSLNDILGNSMDYDFDYSLKRRYRPWAQPRPRAPPAFRRNLYFPNYVVPHPRTFKAVPMPKARSPLRRRPVFYYPPPASVVTRQDDYYSQLEQPQRDSDEELENFIEKVFLKRPRMFQ